MTLNDLKTLIGAGELPAAIAATLEYAEKAGMAEIANTATALSARVGQTRELWNTGQLQFEEYSREHARCTSALLDCVHRLPERPEPSSAKRMVKEDAFKVRLLVLLLVGKALVAGRLLYHWSTGGFNNEYGYACLGILMPTLTGYLYMVLDDYLKSHKKGVQAQRYVSGPLVRFAYFILVAYMLALFFLIERTVILSLSLARFTAIFTLIESLLGGYVSRVISSFFKND
jgi:hypothetical protein